MTSRIDKAKEFGRKKHEGHVRKYTGKPYFDAHCVSVAEAVAANGGNEDMVIAALLHDTVEDTDTTFAEIGAAFGARVSGLVTELTDVYTHEAYPDLNRATRKKLEADRMADASPQAKMIKYHDMKDNTKSITEHDPGFAKVYLPEKEYLMKMMGFA